MKKISWITPEYFIDVDLPVIKYLRKCFEIRLILVLPAKGIDNKKYVQSFLGDNGGVDIHYVYLQGRARSLRNISCYNKIISIAKAFQPDFYYISFMGMPYALPLYMFRLSIKKCIVPCHNVSTPKGATNEKMAEVYKNWWLKTFKNIQVFSQSQYKILTNLHRNKNILMAHLMIKDYGNPTIAYPQDDIIRFLFFGNVVRYKRLDLLLEAVNILYDRGISNFKLIIAGNCKTWESYSGLIKHKNLVETRIERIPNEDVANLFAQSHYFVMPYQDIAQSGAITVAFRYNIPTIVSDIPQFKEFVVEGKTTLTFESQNANSLADSMQYAIKHHKEIYLKLCKNQKKFVDKHFADDVIIGKYVDFFKGLSKAGNRKI